VRHFISDLHVDQASIIRYCGRPFRDLEEMRSAMADYWNAYVEPGDEVWVVGDLTGDTHDPTDALAWLDGLNGSKVLAAGNHDPCWTGRGWHRQREAREWERAYLRTFDEVLHGPQELTIDYGTEWADVLVGHFPRVQARRHEGEFDAWLVNPEDERWLVHGHTHSAQRSKPENREVHVGVDAWGFRPVSEIEVFEEIHRRGRLSMGGQHDGK
jgi:calcineurin-like phosphoesterase family protein